LGAYFKVNQNADFMFDIIFFFEKKIE